VSRRYILIGVEGNHDQAFLSKVLQKLFKFSKCEEESELDQLWRKFIPVYPPKTGKLYLRLDMPSILNTETLSVAIYAGEGSKLITNLVDKLSDMDYLNSLSAFAIVADADESLPSEVAKEYHKGFKDLFPNFPSEVSERGYVTDTLPKLGLYILPNNSGQGVLDTLLCECGEIAYPEYIERAKSYINQFSEDDLKLQNIKWKPFDREKATVATVVSILKPGKTNTASIADNAWISTLTEQHVPCLQNLTHFLKKLFN